MSIVRNQMKKSFAFMMCLLLVFSMFTPAVVAVGVGGEENLINKLVTNEKEGEGAEEGAVNNPESSEGDEPQEAIELENQQIQDKEDNTDEIDMMEEDLEAENEDEQKEPALAGPPKIFVKNYKNTDVVFHPNINLEIEAFDGNGAALFPIVKLGDTTFEPNEAGTFDVKLAEGMNNFNISVLDREGTEAKQNFILSYSKVRVVEFVPAPGQYTNGSFTTDVEKKIRSKGGGLVSLGGFGGYVIIEFEEPVKNNPRNPYGIDFTIFGNSFEINGSPGVYNQEPGAVEVAMNKEGPWYHLAGSEFENGDTYSDYQITYWNTKSESTNAGKWIDNKGNEGVVKNGQYPNADKFPAIDQESFSLSGVSILNDVLASDIGTERKQVKYGYVDSVPKKNDDYEMPNNPYTSTIEGAGGDAMDISWAVDKDGNHIHIDEIKYVKIYTAVNKSVGSIGEISTEVSGLGASKPIDQRAARIKIKNEADQTKIPIGERIQLYADGFDEFNNPITVQEVNWKSSDASVAKVHPITGVVTAISNGTAIITGYLKHDETIHAEFELTTGNKLVPTEIHFTTTGNYSITSDSTVILTANVLDQHGNKMDVNGIEWKTGNDDLVSILPFLNRDYQRNIKALKEGIAEITVEYEGVKSSAIVRVHNKDLAVRADNNKLITSKSIVNHSNLVKAINKASEEKQKKVYLNVVNVSEDRNGDLIKIGANSLIAADEGSISLQIEARENAYQLPRQLIAEDELSSIKDHSVFIASKFSEVADIPEGFKSIGKAIQYKVELAKDNVPIQEITEFINGQNSEITMKFTDHELKDVDTAKLAGFYFNLESGDWEYLGGEYDSKTKSITFSASNPGKFAVFESNNISVQVRIEGHGETIVPLTEISLSPYDITHAVGNNGIGNWHLGNNQSLAIHAIIKALEQKGFKVTDSEKFDFGSGSFITNINGLKMNSVNPNNDGWMYFVNNKDAPVGVGNYELHANDEVTLYFTTNFSTVKYSWFDQTTIMTGVNKDVKLVLSTGEPVKNAEILVNDQPFMMNDQVVVTDEQGVATLRFETPGEYHISAQRMDGDYSNIIRPYSKVIVKESENEKPSDVNVRVSVKGKTDTILENVNLKVGSKQSALNAIKQALDAAKITYEIVDSSLGAYVKDINDETAGSLGGGDGWMYTVNGQAPDVGMAAYELQDGDELQIYYSRWASISSDSKVEVGTTNPTIIVRLVGDTFSSGVTDKGNWHLVDNQSALEIGAITKETTQNVTIALKGTAKAGTISIAALAGAVDGENGSEIISFKISNQTSAAGMLNNTLRFYKENRYNELLFPWGISELSWTEFVGLWGAGKNLTDGTWTLPEWKTIDPKLDKNTSDTEHIRYIFSLLAMGENPSDAWETNRNLYAELAAQQSENGAIGAVNKHAWSILALDTGEKLGHDVGRWNKETKKRALEYLLSQEKPDGGFAYGGNAADPDVTGMVLLALSNYQDDSAVAAAIERAKAVLKKIQLDQGGWASSGSENSNSIATVISGLVAIGEDPLSKDWMKNDYTPLDALHRFQLENGSFPYLLGENPSTNLMATEQSLIALSDIQTGKSVWQRVAEKKSSVQDPVIIEVSEDYELDVKYQNDVTFPVQLEFEKFADNILPKVTANRGIFKLQIPSGTKVDSHDWDNKIQVPTIQITADDVKKEIDSQLIDRQLSKVDGHIKVGGAKRINFDQYVTLTFKGHGKNEAGFIGTNSVFKLIKKYPTANAAKNATEDVYAYTDGADLLIKTKHFTEFLTFQTKDVEQPTNPDTGGGGPSTPSTKTVTLSVEKRTMDGEDIIRSTKVTLQSGDTAFTLLKRIVDEKGVSIDYNGSGATLYVKAIDGLREFDGGPDSGWMYLVNGEYPNHSAGTHTLRDGDVLRWRYTKDLGRDIGGYVPDGDSPGTSGPGGGEGATPPAREVPITSDKPFEFDEESRKDVSIPVIVNFGEKNKELPTVSVARGNLQLEIVAGTKVMSEWDGKLQLPTSLKTSELNLEKINTILELNGKELSKVDSRLKVGGDKTIQFDRHVTLTLKDKGEFEVGFIDENGTFKFIKKYPSANAKDDVYAYTSGKDLIIKTNHFTEFVTFTSTSIAKSNEFTDVTDTWAKEFIEESVQRGLFKGYADGTFRPNNTLTRAQAASLIVRGLELTTDQSSPFKDIGSYAKETQAEIAAAYQHGIIIGQQGNFNPSGEVTRAQMALMLHRAYEHKTGKKYVAAQKAPYSDFGNYDEETVNAISMLYELEIATGSNGRYNPNQSTTRAHAAKMFVNFFESLEG